MIGNYTSITVNDEENCCAICYEPVSKNEILEPCKHNIHTECFLKTHSNLCPICRQDVTYPCITLFAYYKNHTLQPPNGHVIAGCITFLMCYSILIYSYLSK